ncbi:MAG: hypothetical protein RMK19_04120 [Bacteroidia bacterium]|nr:hypothetical protein [Bacteroidia bacterium]MDW8015177.1 hypothetical protein [Bacteroidia bacterium]
MPDTVWLAEPFLVWRVKARDLPLGAEKIATYQRGDTVFALLRIWDLVEDGVRIVWGSETSTVQIKVPPLPSDTLMPLADFSVPSLKEEAQPGFERQLWVVWLMIALLLATVALFPLFRRPLQRRIESALLFLRWGIWLIRWRKPELGQFPAFIQSLKSLLLFYLPMHPGSLTLEELHTLETLNFSLKQALEDLWRIEYQTEFWRKAVSPEEKQRAWQMIWSALRHTPPPRSAQNSRSP